MRHLKHCLNPKVIAALAVVALGVWVFAPGVFAAALPLLVFAICPLSMAAMMHMMRRPAQAAGSGADAGCHMGGADEGSAHESGEHDDGRAVEVLQARVTELEARLAVESYGEETPTGQLPAGTSTRPGPEGDR